MRPVEPQPTLAGNPGASPYVCGRRRRRHHRHHRPHERHDAGASDVTAQHGPACRDESVGIAERSRAGRRRVPCDGRTDRNSGCPGRSGCTARPGHGNARTGTGGQEGPCAPRRNRRCWTDASQRATLLRHHLTRHGVGRGAVVKPASQRNRYRAHLLRHERCCIRKRRHHRSPAQAPRLRCLPSNLIWPPVHPAGGCVCACLAALQGGQAGAAPPTHQWPDKQKLKSDTSPANKRGS